MLKTSRMPWTLARPATFTALTTGCRPFCPSRATVRRSSPARIVAVEPASGAGAEWIEVGGDVDRPRRSEEKDDRCVHAPEQIGRVHRQPMALVGNGEGVLVFHVERV